MATNATSSQNHPGVSPCLGGQYGLELTSSSTQNLLGGGESNHQNGAGVWDTPSKRRQQGHGQGHHQYLQHVVVTSGGEQAQKTTYRPGVYQVNSSVVAFLN